MAIDNYLNGGAVGRNTGKGAIGSNTGKGFVDSNINKNNNDSSSNVGDIYMHPPYAVIVEPRNEGGNVTQGNKNYQETLNAYNAAKSRLINATDEAAALRNSWSAPPRVALENGKLNLYGTDDFLKSNEAKQLLEVFKTMEGSTYNTEKLNQQIEAWNSTLQKMSEDYNDAVDQMNQVNNAILTTAKNPNPHLLTFSEMQKIGNSAAIGKQPDARTSKSKIFVGYEWDDDGNMKEKWVEAKEVFKEFDKISSDKKRSAYHSLMTQANNGDVAAYSKLLYLQGGSEGGPANVDYDKTVGDFFNTLGNNILMNLGGFAQGVFDYARFFNVGQITANLSDYAEYFDQRDFWDLAAAVLAPGLYADQYDSRGEISRTVKNAVEDYSAAVSWENAFFSELTPGSTGAASTIGGVTGAALGMAFHLYSSGVGQKVMAGDKYSQGIITNAVNKANEALISTGKFVPYEIRLGRVKIKTDTLGTPLADGGGIIGGATNAQKVYETMATSGVYAVPTIIAKNFPNIAEAMGYAALIKNGGIGAVLSGSGRGTSLLETTVSGGVSGGYFSETSHTFATTFGNIIENGKTYNALLDYIGTPNTGALGSVTEKAMWNMVAKGFRTAQTLIPLTGFAAARNADEYLKRVKAGEDLGDMTEYIISNTAKDVAFGGALIGAGAVIGKIRAVAKAGRVSPADAASSTFATDFGTQGGFYQPESPYYQKRLEPGNLNADEMASLQRTMSEIMTVNNEVFAGVPTNNGAMTSALPGTYIEGAARTFGAMSPRKAFKYSVEETFDGAYLVTETTDLDTNTKVTTREFRNSVAEAEKEISEKSIPSTSPKTLANNDQVSNIKVAPLTVDGKAPATMPEGVSQVKFEPGTVYRTPDGLADEIADLVEKAGGSFEAVEAAYQEAVEYAANNMDEPAPEVPFLPERLSSDFTLEDRELLRAAGWAKAHGYNAVPLRVSKSSVRKTFRMGNIILGKAPIDVLTPTGTPKRGAFAPAKYYESFPIKHLNDDELDEQLEKIPYDLRKRWYAQSSRKAREELAELAFKDKELRNAALSKMYDEWKDETKLVGGEARIPYEEWLVTDIYLYRWDNENNGDSSVLSFSFSPGGYPQFGRTPTVIAVKPIETTGMLDFFDGEGSEQEVFVPREIVEKRGGLDDELKERQRTAIIKANGSAPAVSDIKTYPETLTRDMILGGVSDGFDRGDLMKALITNRVTVYSDSPISDGANVTVNPSGKYTKEVNLSDVAWEDASNGVLASDTVYPTLFDFAESVKDNTRFDKQGVRVKDVQIGGYSVPIDAEIADRIAQINKDGYVTYNSHSGIGDDHIRQGDSGGGYIQFSGKIGDSKKAAIKKAAEKAGMGVDEGVNMLYGPDLTVRQSNTADGIRLEDVIKMANAETVAKYDLPEDDWVGAALDRKMLDEVLSYRRDTEERIYKEHGGYAQPDDSSRRKAWDVFFGALGYEKQYSGGEIARVRQEEVVETPHNIVGMQYGVPYKYFADDSSALEWAKEEGGRAIHKLDDGADILDRPPMTTQDLQENPLLLEAGGNPQAHVEKFDELMETLPELMGEDGAGSIDYLRGVADITRSVNAIYTEVASNVNLDDIYERYAMSIYEDKDIELTPDEKAAIAPLSYTLDKLGHYFDPSGKSLTKEFYLPTAVDTSKKVSLEQALLGKDEAFDPDHPVDTGFNDILLDINRIGDAGFWKKRTGDLFRDEDGNFTMARSGSLEENITAYTVSALTRGRYSLATSVNNEVARSKYDRNRSQITAKQAYAGVKEADKIRGKTRAYHVAINKDADKLADLKNDYDGGTIDEAMKAKNYAKDLDFVQSTNHAAQLLGYNQFLEMTPIKGSVIRYGTQSNVYRGTTNIRRKLEKINITGPLWVRRNQAFERVGFGLNMSEANIKKYGTFRSGEKAVNLGEILNTNLDSAQLAKSYLDTLNNKISSWTEQSGDLVPTIYNDTQTKFPLLTDYKRSADKLIKQLVRNYHASSDPKVVYEMNVKAITQWYRNNSATEFNNAIMMTDISNLDERTLDALDEAAAYIYVGAPLKRSKFINGMLQAETVAKLGGNVSPMVGNLGAEIFTRLPGYIGWADTVKAIKRALNPKEAARIKNIIDDLPSQYESAEDNTMLQNAKGFFKQGIDKATGLALKPLTWSETVKNIVYYAAGEINAERKGITNPAEIQRDAIRFVGEHAIAGGKGTTPGISESSLGSAFFLFRNFTIRNFDDFVDFVEKASRGETGDNYWDAKYEKKYGNNNKTKDGRNRASFKLAAKAVGGRVLRAYFFWLLVGSYFGKNFIDALGGDPTGVTDGGRNRGLYDDEDTEENEGMTDLDNFINNIPAGVIFGTLQDLYFAARRRGVDSNQFLSFDVWNDATFNRSLENHLPLGVAYNRFADMLELLDRGYSFSSTGRKTYAAPESASDVIKGFLFGKATTENSLAYGKYRYGNVNLWGDISSGDWMDFAMNANPFTGGATFDTTRKNYTGVFDGSYNDIATMQLIIAEFKKRQQSIIDDFNHDKYRYGGDWDGLTDDEKVAKAKDIREKKINDYTADVQRAVDAFADAGNALSDKQITNLMYLFDFHEGEEDDEWNSSVARERYVEAGLPDYNAAGIQRGTTTENGQKQEVTKGMLDRSLVLQNAQQGFYGASKEAANAIKDALKDFKSTYKEYNTRVKALNEKYFAAREKNKKSAETKQLSEDLEKLQNEYLDKLFAKLEPVIDKYGTASIGTYDGADVLSEYMGNMIPYSSIKKYGQTYSSGNDIVYGQLTEWLQKRLGRNAPTAPSDKEVTSGIAEIKKLLDQGKTATAKSKARAILEKIGRGSLGARRDDVETLRSYLYD